MSFTSFFRKLSNWSSFDFFFICLTVLYITTAIVSLRLGWYGDDSLWNVGVAAYLLDFDPYSHYQIYEDFYQDTSPINIPPLTLILIYPFVVLGGFFGWDLPDIVRIYPISLLLIDVVTIDFIIRLIKRIQPSISLKVIKVTLLLLFFSGYFLYSSAFQGRPETLAILLTLTSVRLLLVKPSPLFFGREWFRSITSRYFVSGILLALALYAKQSAIFIIFPLYLYVLFKEKKINEIFLSLVTTGITLILLFLPFLLVDAPSITKAMIGFALGKHHFYGPNMWWLWEVMVTKFFNWPAGLEFAWQYSSKILLSISFASMGWLFLKRRITSLHALFGAVSLNLLIFYLFGFFTQFHYVLMLYVYLLLWDVSRRKVQFPIWWVTFAILYFVPSRLELPVWQAMLLSYKLILGSVISYQLISHHE